MKRNKFPVRSLAVAAILAAFSFVLQLLGFPLPGLLPPFLKVDFADLPALLASFSLGPVWGIAVCLVKNLLHMLIDQSTMGIGQLSNFLLSSVFVCAAGVIYRKIKSRKGALLGSVSGAFLCGLFGMVSNYFLIYPMYMKFVGWPKEALLGMYESILPLGGNLFFCLVVFNLPFTILKCLIVSGIVFAIYKPLSPVLKGRKK